MSRAFTLKTISVAATILGMPNISHADSVSIQLNGPMAPLFGIQSNIFHGKLTACGFRQQNDNTCGSGPALTRSYAAWIDGPINPYKYDGSTYFQLPHAQNYRIKVPSHDWGNRYIWEIEPSNNGIEGAPITPPQADTNQSHYNMGNWIFSPYVQYPNIYGLTHHEWYPTTEVFSGKTIGTSKPVWGIGWISSNNGGASWAMKPINYSAPSNADRMVLTPEPWNPAYTGEYGFAHPSNIVKEGAYYYAFVTSVSYRNTAQRAIGVSLIRTFDLTSSLNWQYWNGAGWTTVSKATYQGNSGPQQPYIFWEEIDSACSHLFAHNVRKHASSGKWIVLGSAYCQPSSNYQATYTWISDLSNPSLLDRTSGGQPRYPQLVAQGNNGIPSNFYYSFFDVSGNQNIGDNYEVVNNNPLLVVVGPGRDDIYHQFLTIIYTP